MKQKQKDIFAGIIFAIFLLFFANFTTLSFLDSGPSHREMKIISFDKVFETSAYFTYEGKIKDFNWYNPPVCSTNDPIGFFSYSFPQIYDGIEFNDPDELFIVSLDISNVKKEVSSHFVSADFSKLSIINCDNNHPEAKFYLEDEEVSCKVSGENVDCVLSGNIGYSNPTGGPTRSSIVNFPDGVFRVKFLKEGVECLEDLDCEEGFECKNNICQEIYIPPEKINVYRLSNNVCTFIQILPSERTQFDYDTLSECEENINLPPPSSNIPILVWIISIILLIGLLIFLYTKTKKR